MLHRILITLLALVLFTGCSIPFQGTPDPTPTTVAETAATATIPPTTTPPPTATTMPSPTATMPQQPTAAATAAATATPTAEPTAAATIEPDLAETFHRIERDVADVRELPFNEDVRIEVISRAQLRTNLEQQLADEYSQEDADLDTLSLWLLRLIEDPDLDLYAFQLDLLSEQVLGYYDPEVGEMFVVDDSGELSATAEFTLAHELVHALQDQHYNLMDVRFINQNDADRDTAAVALIEGDAQLAQFDYLNRMEPMRMIELLTGMGATDTSVLDSAPPYVRESLYFPYEYGLMFAEALHNAGGWAALDAAFADPPTSSEQILHPEKYMQQRDEPRTVEERGFAGWELLTQDSLGEFDLRVLLRENGVREWEQAAEGWGGGRYFLYGQSGAQVIVVGTVWDSVAEAQEFYAALLSTLPAATNGVYDAGQGRFMTVAMEGDAVWFASGTDADSARAALGS